MQTYYKTVLATILQWQHTSQDVNRQRAFTLFVHPFRGSITSPTGKHSCKKMKLDSSFIPMQVPPDAKLMGQVFMGSSSSWGMGVLTNTWYGSLSENGKKKQK